MYNLSYSQNKWQPQRGTYDCEVQKTATDKPTAALDAACRVGAKGAELGLVRLRGGSQRFSEKRFKWEKFVFTHT